MLGLILRPAEIQNYLENVVEKTMQILPYDQEAAALHGEWRAKLAAKGIQLPFADSQIASIAVVNRLILVTRNVKDARSLPGLKVENWFEG